MKIFSILLTLSVCLASQVGLAEWDGVYYQADTPGNAVEFSGAGYLLRTHEGDSVNEGVWKSDEGDRTVTACCREMRFSLAVDDTLSEARGGTWHRQPPTWPLQKVPRGPLRIRVVDAGSGDPIPEYRFRYWLSSPKGKEYPDWLGMKTVRSSSGAVTIQAPLTCELGLKLDALDYLCYGSGYETHSLDIKSSDTNRTVIVKLQRGLVVEGTVVDAETGRPVVGAKVAPLIEYHPCESPNRNRQVSTDMAGRFCVHAVSDWRGLNVDHPQYGETDHREPETWDTIGNDPGRRTTIIRLTQPNAVRGFVRALEGQPLSGVDIRSHNGRRAQTDDDGAFEIYGATGELSFNAPRYIETTVGIATSTPPIEVTLQPQYELVGRVLNPQGAPVTNFTVVTRDGRYCGDWSAKKMSFCSRDGSFRMDVSYPITNVVAVHADGFALTQTAVVLTRPPIPVTLRMCPGVSVSGKLSIPPGFDQVVTVSLCQQREGALWRNYLGGSGWVDDMPIASGTTGGQTAIDMSTRHCIAAKDGGFLLTGVSPGSHTLSIVGQDLVPIRKTIRVTNKGRSLSPIVIKKYGVGTVRGRVFRPYPCSRGGTCSPPEPWPFADGELFCPYLHGESEDGIAFKADEEGNYCVTNIPAGPVAISVRYNITFDIIDALSGTGTVHTGETSVIDIRPETPNLELLKAGRCVRDIEFRVGDGSLADFQRGAGLGVLDKNEKYRPPEWTLECHRGHAASFEGRLSKESPLTYTNRVFSITNLYVGDVSLCLGESNRGWGGEAIWKSSGLVVDGAKTNSGMVIPLPANSLSGRVTGCRYGWSVYIYLIDEATRSVVRTTSPLDDGTFLIRFVPEGRYTVLAYEDDDGWYRKAGVSIKGKRELGELALRPGLCARAQILADDVPLLSPDDFQVKMINKETGVILRQTPDRGENGGMVIFDNVWPGGWTLSLHVANDTLFSTNMTFQGVAPVVVDMTWTRSTLDEL